MCEFISSLTRDLPHTRFACPCIRASKSVSEHTDCVLWCTHTTCLAHLNATARSLRWIVYKAYAMYWCAIYVQLYRCCACMVVNDQCFCLQCMTYKNKKYIIGDNIDLCYTLHLFNICKCIYSQSPTHILYARDILEALNKKN